jgi:hypothetical protein
MRWWVALSVALIGCKAQPPCGFDEHDNEVPHCEWHVDKVPEAIVECPGDNWATPECETCACDTNGKILCTQPQQPCQATTAVAGS